MADEDDTTNNNTPIDASDLPERPITMQGLVNVTARQKPVKLREEVINSGDSSRVTPSKKRNDKDS